MEAEYKITKHSLSGAYNAGRYHIRKLFTEGGEQTIAIGFSGKRNTAEENEIINLAKLICSQYSQKAVIVRDFDTDEYLSVRKVKRTEKISGGAK